MTHVFMGKIQYFQLRKGLNWRTSKSRGRWRKPVDFLLYVRREHNRNTTRTLREHCGNTAGTISLYCYLRIISVVNSGEQAKGLLPRRTIDYIARDPYPIGLTTLVEVTPRPGHYQTVDVACQGRDSETCYIEAMSAGKASPGRL